MPENVDAHDVLPRKLGPTSGATEGGSEEAVQQERSLEGEATSGSETACRAQRLFRQSGNLLR
jgi:hypothetical protein